VLVYVFIIFLIMMMTDSGPIVTPALILTFLLLTLGNYSPKGIQKIIIYTFLYCR